MNIKYHRPTVSIKTEMMRYHCLLLSKSTPDKITVCVQNIIFSIAKEHKYFHEQYEEQIHTKPLIMVDVGLDHTSEKILHVCKYCVRVRGRQDYLLTNLV